MISSKVEVMGAPAATAIFLLSFAAACSNGQGRAKIVLASIEPAAQGAVAVVRVEFVKEPVGSPAEMSIELGSVALEGSGRFDWPKLAELDNSPATTASTPPQPGQELAFRVPFGLKPDFKTKPGTEVELSMSVFWGTKDELPIEQDSKKLSLEGLYKKESGIKPFGGDPRTEAESAHEKPGPPPIGP